MKFYINAKILVGFAISILIIFFLGLLSFTYIRNVIEIGRWGAHARQVLFHTEQVRSFLMEVQTDQLRYALTGDSTFLKPYPGAVRAVRNYIGELDSLVADNPKQSDRVTQLRKVAERRIAFSDTIIEIRRKSFESAKALVMTFHGAKIMAAAQSIIDEIQKEENGLIQERSASVGKQFYRFAYAFVGLLIAMFAILVILTYAVNASLKARAVAEQKLKRASDRARDLYENAPCGYFSVDNVGAFENINATLLRWLGYTKEELVGKFHFTEILKMNEGSFLKEGLHEYLKKGSVNNVEAEMVLKNNTSVPTILNAVAILDSSGNLISSRCTVFDNTERKKAEEEVRQTNRELEAFSYSVSHDLRAPLRSIGGYAQILRDDYYDKLDEEGQRVIGIVIKNAKRMGRLIDDLLDFSRTSRREIGKSQIDMDEFVTLILDELMQQEGQRNIKIDKTELLSGAADINMIRQVWVNLLSNALKYTQKKEAVCIEIGSYEDPKEIVYFVKDNGVGFNMAYYDKLFGVFQRLHKAEEFEGTGVGLAFVKRIIEKHRGRVWAEGELNIGATFYFSIPKL
ncbi:MAG TPA: CHASE3 domain-containing protein [Cyclobacteriaceae bacterium]|nr:CHASE3 domain-containing protein [Cyclobacteriaceae bacterium]